MLARLTVHLKSNTRGLDKGLKSSRRGISAFGIATKAALGLAGIAVAGFAGFRLLNSQMQALDRTAKLSQQTGFGAGSIAGLGFAAEQTGTSVATLEKGLQNFSRRMGEAATKGGPVADVLAQLGTPIQDLKNLKPDQQLMAVADGLQQINSPAERAAAAYQLFGRQGQELVNMLGQGSEGLREFISEAEGLGLGFSDEELGRVEAANDALNRVKRAFGAIWSQVTIAAAPAISFVASGLQWLVSIGQSVFGRIKTLSAEAWAWVAAKLKPLTPLFLQLKSLGIAYFTALKGIAFAVIGGIIGVFMKLWGFIQSGLSAVMGWFGVSFQDMLELGTTVLAMLEFAWTNWQAVAQLALLQVGLSAVRFFNQIVYFFSTQLPALLSWFSENWSDIWFTAIDYVLTIMINLGQNIRNIMSGIWDFIASGGTADFSVTWTPLEEGFRSAIKKMPDIPPRVMGPLEQSLQNEVTALGSGLKTGMQSLVNERLAQLDDFKNRTQATLSDVTADANDENGAADGESATGNKGAGGALNRGSARKDKTRYKTNSWRCRRKSQRASKN